jgi:hypothetical protein
VDEAHAALIRAHLTEIAQALTALGDFGVRVSARHGAVITDYGFLTPVDDGSWQVRMKVYDPQMQPVGDADDD